MKYKIGELAKLLNISTNTVRRYENQGYIHAVRNEDSGYRYYDEDGVFDITNIRLLRKYGFPHEKLLEMQSYTIQEEIAAYQERMQQMDKEIAYMTYVRHRIKDDVLLMQKAAQMISRFLRYSERHYKERHVLQCQKTDCIPLQLYFPQDPQLPYLPV